jgi:hypothetical protein
MAGVMARTRVFALLGAGSLLFAGCSASAPAPSSYLTAGNAICGAELEQLNQLARPATPEAAVSYLPRVLAIMESQRDRLSALTVPARKRAEFAAGLAGQGQLAALLRHVLRQLQAGMVEVGTFVRVEAQSDGLRAEINRHFRDAGLGRCAA